MNRLKEIFDDKDNPIVFRWSLREIIINSDQWHQIVSAVPIDNLMKF